jgi:hypothetical protein
MPTFAWTTNCVMPRLPDPSLEAAERNYPLALTRAFSTDSTLCLLCYWSNRYVSLNRAKSWLSGFEL